jgi:hypothetical protein
MHELDTAYTQGFMDKSAELGVEPEQLVKDAQSTTYRTASGGSVTMPTKQHQRIQQQKAKTVSPTQGAARARAVAARPPTVSASGSTAYQQKSKAMLARGKSRMGSLVGSNNMSGFRGGPSNMRRM